ncbi:hypothetical protein B0H14DRAFT_3432874 [Mycena olivaceomarginata]|nr:hypothetical protein B0H14DRAFT_3432874 [Mycena olivaceomarginata]
MHTLQAPPPASVTVSSRPSSRAATARSLERLSHLQAQGNPNLCVRQLDVTAGAAAIAAVVTEAAGVWGRLDVVVNNAGAGYPGLLEEGGSDLLRKQFAVNFFGVMDVCAASLPFLRAQRSGTIVVVGSRSAWKPEIPVRLQCSSAVCRILNLPRPFSRDSGTTPPPKPPSAPSRRRSPPRSRPSAVRVLLVEPGAFRTNVSAHAYFTQHPIADYDALREASAARFGSLLGTEPGDPARAMEAVVDVVRGEGRARGRALA